MNKSADTVRQNSKELVIPFAVFRELDFRAVCKSLGMSTRAINSYINQRSAE